MRSLLLKLTGSLTTLRRVPMVALAVTVAVAILVVGVNWFRESEPVQAADGPSIELLARSQFPDSVSGIFLYRPEGSWATSVVHLNTASDVVVVKITLAPGEAIGWHTHPGPATYAVTQGTLTVTHGDDCSQHVYETGQAGFDTGSAVERADNFGDEDVIIYVNFLGIPPGPPTIPAADPGC
jgi:mannose-6-phosphate isomerase-like protein (cupin superfamily)